MRGMGVRLYSAKGMAKTTKPKQPAKKAAAKKAAKPPRARSAALKQCPIVGIGASAGGIDALSKLVPHIPADSDLAYVVILHLHPEMKSNLAELLARHAKIPVVPITDGMAAEPNRIYVIPPNATATMRGCKLRLAAPAEARGFRTPIDNFFISLAEDQKENAACLILSGTGSDGTVGLRAVKEQGGMTLAQSGAEHEGMMRSAVATGLVDFVLPAEDMPAKLAQYFTHAAGFATDKVAEALQEQDSDHLVQICALLRARTGHDFSGYKDRTLIRRVQRRMQVVHLREVGDYLERLRTDPQEVDFLFQDLLIGVTNFFRDQPVWDAVEKVVIPKLFEGKGPDDSVRVWVVGCSTGEEAYSLAMLLRDHEQRSKPGPKLQVFASDIDEQALDVARLGRYPLANVENVDQKRLGRYFTREDGTYRISSEIREFCLFAVHNVLRDAPFSKIDLISCRNLLIYFSPEVQSRVIPLFHYALRNSGHLILGTSENVTRHARLFAGVDKGYRIYQRRALQERLLPEFPLVARRDRRTDGPPSREQAQADQSLKSKVEAEVLDRYAPAYVVVDADGELMLSSGRTGKYLELPAGVPNANVLSLARRGLRLELRTALHRAVATGATVVLNGLTVGTNGGRQALDLIVQPMPESLGPDKLFMVVFQDRGPLKTAGEEPDEQPEDKQTHTMRQLEAELRATRERLQTTTEELESSNEELKSSNEELSSMNEELQSANEELETSKEELQSINEELQTVNAELNDRVDELSRANSDIANLLESTQIATVFLDNDLCIQSFTPAAKDVFHLVESDAGRSITHVRARFNHDTLEADAKRVLRTLAPFEKTVQGADHDGTYVLRIVPYRTVENVVSGAVLTFVDITRITAAETRIGELTLNLHEHIENLGAVLDLVPVGVLIVEDIEGQKIRMNSAAARLLNMQDARPGWQPLSRPIQLFDGKRQLALWEHPLVRSAADGARSPRFEGQLVRVDGSKIDVAITATPLATALGSGRGAIAAIMDISEMKQAEAHQDVLLHELQHRVKNILATVSSLAMRMVKSSRTLDEFSDAFLGRLLAMGAMHELLSARQWHGADLRSLIATALAPNIGRDGKNLAVQGPEVVIKPNAAATLGMVFHELATNAVKYGALSEPTGRISIQWTLDGADGAQRVILSWAEKGGPRVAPPTNEGFGTVFVERAVQYELDGTAAFEFEPSGVTCTISFPLHHNVERDDLSEAAGG
jgi:two-component system, chemotaxis family, CheB/CheR fusion protein